jgi:hypothetical protein
MKKNGIKQQLTLTCSYVVHGTVGNGTVLPNTTETALCYKYVYL